MRCTKADGPTSGSQVLTCIDGSRLRCAWVVCTAQDLSGHQGPSLEEADALGKAVGAREADLFLWLKQGGDSPPPPPANSQLDTKQGMGC